METKKAVYACLLLAIFLAILYQATSAGDDEANGYSVEQLQAMNGQKNQLESVNCGSECARRCSKVQAHPDRCLKYCNHCCGVCKCVPSGFYGNKDECPCYRDLKNDKGGSKCP